MQIYGLNKTTLLDYPEHVAATVFCGGCNFRCPFCHNKGLIEGSCTRPTISEPEFFQFLKKRKVIISGVCITGGEPTLQPDLAEFIYRIKEQGFLVKLDTNGYRPEIIEELTGGNLLDYIAMDIKSGPSGYGKASGIPEPDLEKIRRSIDFIMRCGVKYEFRTTVVKGIHTAGDFDEIGPMLQGAEVCFLQAYKAPEGNELPGLHSFDKGQMEDFAKRLRPFVRKAVLRGME